LDVERWINSEATKRERPEIGEDVKVMGIRSDGAAELTVACAFVDSQRRDAAAYLDRKASRSKAIDARVAARLAEPVTVAVNAADDPARGSFYLTTTAPRRNQATTARSGAATGVNGPITPGHPLQVY
jgi:S-adenosylmethionine synthetase